MKKQENKQGDKRKRQNKHVIACQPKTINAKKMTARNEQQKQQKIVNYLTKKIQLTSIIIAGLQCNKNAGTPHKKHQKRGRDTGKNSQNNKE